MNTHTHTHTRGTMILLT